MMSGVERSDQLLLVILSSPSGAGKTTLWHRLLDDASLSGIRVSISHTTRPPRGSEEHAKDYYFVTGDQFGSILDAGGFAEHAEVHGNFYGTTTEEIDRIAGDPDSRAIIFDIDWQGARQLVSRYPDALTILILPPNLEELRRRLTSRGTESEEDIELRMRNAVEEIARYREFGYIVVNDDLETAYTELVTLIEARGLSTRSRGHVAEAMIRQYDEETG